MNGAVKAKYISNTANVVDRAVQAARAGLWRAGQLALDYARNDVPVETGTLRRSGVVSTKPPRMEEIYEAAKNGRLNLEALGRPMKGISVNRRGRVSLSKSKPIPMYVSYNTPYAARLHERFDWKPRDWKYLDTGKRPRRKVPKPALGRPKYLYTAIQRVNPQIKRLIAIEMKARGF